MRITFPRPHPRDDAEAVARHELLAGEPHRHPDRSVLGVTLEDHVGDRAGRVIALGAEVVEEHERPFEREFDDLGLAVSRRVLESSSPSA